MSFSTRVKEELVLIKGTTEERRAELSALLRVGGYFEINAGGLSFSFETDKAMITKRVFALSRLDCNLLIQVRVNKNTGFRGINRYKLTMPPQKDLEPFLNILGILDDSFLPVNNLPLELLSNKEGQKAYLRGLFLCRGSINNPARSYYLEIILEKESLAKEIVDLLKQLDLKVLMRKRRQFWVVYCNQIEQLLNILSLIGAHKTLLDLESQRTFKEIKSNINRKLNWESANMDKTIQASLEQLENIQIIAQNIGLANLSPALQDMALLRLENPYLTLKELGEKGNPPISKSGVNHRLRKLNEIAERFKNVKLNDKILDKGKNN